ncbi:MAG: lipopolysaccharide heptosyltransferase II [Deltaproteobacteria bacterium]|nr:lipopolysaccharide heptosyltransferase II [Deltaproteobacteria bacterium]
MRILLVQTSFLGDTILSTPLIAALKKLHPQAELWMMTTPLAATLVKRDPLLAGVITFAKRDTESGLGGLWKQARKLRALNFDLVYSLHRSARTSLLLYLSRIPRRIGFRNARLGFLYHELRTRPQKLHDVERNLALLDSERHPDLPDSLRLFAPEIGELPPEIRAELPAPRSYVMMVPGSAWETKRWSTEGYRRVAEYLCGKGIDVVLTGSPEEAAICEEVAAGLKVLNLAGRSDLESAIYLARNARLLICNDSMALHLASAFKTPTVTVFCATVPAFGFGPWQNPKARIVEHPDLACRPCARHGGRKCPNRTWACSRELKADTVIGAVAELLEIDGDKGIGPQADIDRPRETPANLSPLPRTTSDCKP